MYLRIVHTAAKLCRLVSILRLATGLQKGRKQNYFAWAQRRIRSISQIRPDRKYSQPCVVFKLSTYVNHFKRLSITELRMFVKLRLLSALCVCLY